MRFFTKPAVLTTTVFVLCAAAVMTLGGKSEPALRLEPALAELSGIKEGEVARVPLRLVNSSRRPLVVESVKASCGCMEIVTADAPLEKGYEIPAHGSIPVQVSIATAGFFGERWNSVAIQGRTGARTVDAVAQVKLDILANLRAEPPQLVLREMGDQARRATIHLADGQHDPGTELVKVVPSDPERVTAELARAATAEKLATGLKHRYDLHVSVAPRPQGKGAAPLAEEFSVELFAEDSTQPVLTVPIICQYKRPAYYCEPEVLVLRDGAPGERFAREIQVHCENAALDQMRILDKPAFVGAELKRAETGRLLLRVEWAGADAPLGDEPLPPIVIGVADESGARCALRLIRQPANDS